METRGVHALISDQAFGRLFEALPAPYLILCPDFTIVAANDAYLSVTLTARETIVGRGLFEVFPDNPDDPAATGTRNLRTSLEEVLHTRRPHRMAVQKYDIPNENFRPGGFEERFWSPLNSPVFDAEGKCILLIHHVEDVTDLVRVERLAADELAARKVIQLSEARFHQIADSMPQIVWTARADGFVDWFNEWWYRYTGAEHGEYDWTTPMHPDDVGPTRTRWQTALETGEVYETRYRFRRAQDGEYRWHLGRAVPIKDSLGRLLKWIGSSTDVHEQTSLVGRLEAEREVRQRFVAALTHDLRTPLSAARMAAQLIARRAGEEELVLTFAGRIRENMDRADLMIRDLLDVNALQAGETLRLEIEPCSLNQLVTEALRELSTIHGDRFVIRAAANISGHWSCSGLRRVIDNLCTNAIKYGAPYRPVTISLAQVGETIEIAVHNEGPPISPSDQRTLFEQFRRSESAQTSGQKGWGLGLTLVKGLSEAHGGSVALESAAEVGTIFRVALPIDARPFLSSGVGAGRT